MQEYIEDSRLVWMHDSETNEEVWLRRHGLQLSTREHMQYILDMEQRGADVPMTEDQIATFFLGPKWKFTDFFGLGRYFAKEGERRNAQGICYHPTHDTEDNFFKFDPEAPAVGHVLWSETNDELRVESIAADAEFPFRKLIYKLLLDELKSFVIMACGYEYAEKISAVLKGAHEQRFYEQNGFRTTQMPENVRVAFWVPEFEGAKKQNRWREKHHRRST